MSDSVGVIFKKDCFMDKEMNPSDYKTAEEVANAFQQRRQIEKERLAKWQEESRKHANNIKRKFFHMGLIPASQLGDQSLDSILGIKR